MAGMSMGGGYFNGTYYPTDQALYAATQAATYGSKTTQNTTASGQKVPSASPNTPAHLPSNEMSPAVSGLTAAHGASTNGGANNYAMSATPSAPVGNGVDAARLLADQELARQKDLLTTQSQLQSGEQRQGADLQAAAEARRAAMLPDLVKQTVPGTVSGGGVNPQQEEDARREVFARAKDQIGLETRGALNTLRDEFAGSGNIGAERAGTMSILSGGAGKMGDVTRDQAINSLDRAYTLSDRNYAGDITQRGQSMSMTPALMGLLTARGLY